MGQMYGGKQSAKSAMITSAIPLPLSLLSDTPSDLKRARLCHDALLRNMLQVLGARFSNMAGSATARPRASEMSANL